MAACAGGGGGVGLVGQGVGVVTHMLLQRELLGHP